MSDTPRTDMEAFYPSEKHPQLVHAEFARALERDLARLSAENEALRAEQRTLRNAALVAAERAEKAEAENEALRAAPVAQPVARDWAEDYAHENGHYQCLCSSCGNVFYGHKRRVTCKACAATEPKEKP